MDWTAIQLAPALPDAHPRCRPPLPTAQTTRLAHTAHPQDHRTPLQPLQRAHSAWTTRCVLRRSPEVLALALQTAFAMVDSDFVNALLRLATEAEEFLAAVP